MSFVFYVVANVIANRKLNHCVSVVGLAAGKFAKPARADNPKGEELMGKS